MNPTEQLFALNKKNKEPMTLEEATQGYWLRTQEEAAVRELPTLEPITFAHPPRLLDHVTPEEINGLYASESAALFLKVVDGMKAKRRGSWPLPGWHAYMIASGALEVKHKQFQHDPNYETWVREIYTPQPGSCYYQTQDNVNKTLRECIYCPGILCHCREPTSEKEEPRKKSRHEAAALEKYHRASNPHPAVTAWMKAGFPMSCVEEDYEVTPWQEMDEK